MEGPPNNSQGVYPRSRRVILPRNLRRLVERNRNYFPRELLQCRLPRPDSGVRLIELGIKTGALNALTKAGYAVDPTRLSDLTAAAALAIRGLGIGGLLGLVEALYERQRRRKGTPIPRDLRIRLAEPTFRPGPYLSRVVPEFPKRCHLEDLELTLSTFNVLKHAGFLDDPGCLAGRTVRELLTIPRMQWKGICDLVEAIDLARRQRRTHTASMTLDELVLNRLVPGRDQRNRTIVAQYLGLGGKSPAILQTIGKRYGLTKERIRTICWARADDLAELGSTPVVRGIQRALKRATPGRVADIEKGLAKSGLIHGRTRLATVLRLLQAIGSQPAYVIYVPAAQNTPIVASRSKLATTVRKVAVAEVQQRGSGRLRFVWARICRRTNSGRNSIKGILENLETFEWLDRPRGWFFIKTDRPGEFRRRIRKVLSVTPVVSFVELRRALCKGRGAKAAPPLWILRELLPRLRELHVDGDRIVGVGARKRT